MACQKDRRRTRPKRRCSRLALYGAKLLLYIDFFGGAVRSRTGLTGFAIRGITALLPRRHFSRKREAEASLFCICGAGKESRTLDLNLGKVALYQLSYSRTRGPAHRQTCQKFWSGKRVSNSRPQPWQGCALPTELFPQSSRRVYATKLARPIQAHWRVRIRISV